MSAGGFWDFTSNMASKDTAYTDVFLGAHTDNTYFSDPAGLQMFHLLSHTDGNGGQSLLVDGFNAAKELQMKDPTAYEILSTVPIYSHASGNDGISIQPYIPFPALVHDPTGKHLIQVRWNPYDRAAIDIDMAQMESWYQAARYGLLVCHRRGHVCGTFPRTKTPLGPTCGVRQSI